MPCLQITTSFPVDNAAAVVAALSKIVATQTSKPEGYVQVILIANATISFGGEPGNSVFMDLRSIGSISRAQNKKTSAALTEYFVKNFKVPAGRVYISFANAAGENWGYDGSTFG